MIDIRQQDCLEMLGSLRDATVQTLVTSPPYGIGKAYENRSTPTEWADAMAPIVQESARVAAEHMFWQVGNHVHQGVVTPLDIFLYPLLARDGWVMRNRMVWTYGHGLHARSRFSGRYETILWFTKGDSYLFDLDAVRVPQKYPAKRYYKGDKKGELSGNPKGKNPGDVWDISNVKHNHPEKTAHPCQFPEALIKRVVLASTREGDTVADIFLGSGTTAAVCAKTNRRFIGCDTSADYVAVARARIATIHAQKENVR